MLVDQVKYNVPPVASLFSRPINAICKQEKSYDTSSLLSLFLGPPWGRLQAL